VQEFDGTRCQSVRSGGEEFLEAVDRNRRIGAGDRSALAQGREALLALCQSTSGYGNDEAEDQVPELPHSFASPEGREFGAYLAGAAAFYRGDWRAALERFVALRTAKDEWVKETALYMTARSELGAAAEAAVDEWGYFDNAKSDREGAARAARALEAYLRAYPNGRYSESAAGLTRRAGWLQGETAQRGTAYARLLAAADPTDLDAAALIEEIDNKFLFAEGADKAMEGPWLLAAHDFLRMRGNPDQDEYYGAYGRHDLPQLTAAELAAQEAVFARQPELFQFLKANLAFYVDKDYRAVLQLLPDDARKPAYTPLQFSRQVLRGQALAALKDRNEAGFWQELMGGAKGLYQRPTVELGLALDWERKGEVAKVFAPGSPIEEPLIRAILLEHAAGPEVLRSAAAASGSPERERDTAAFVLLYKQLSRGAYGAAVRDFALVRRDAPIEGWLGNLEGFEEVPVGLFTRGAFEDGYDCPELKQTVAALASNPRDVKGRLCLGDFYRLNGFDDLDLDGSREEGELGSFQAYPGEPVPRARFYADILREPDVSHADRAYALYRAVYCYAPAGYNSCGGEDASEEQRRAWFRRLKREFADTRWGQEIEYYW